MTSNTHSIDAYDTVYVTPVPLLEHRFNKWMHKTTIDKQRFCSYDATRAWLLLHTSIFY